MPGIKSCGVYLPIWRLDLASVKAEWRGERPIAGFDEDSLTMAVAAGVNCLNGHDRDAIDGLFFASTTFPYREKPASVTAAVALDLRPDILTLDFANTLRAGTGALTAASNAVKSGAARQVLVLAADMRLSTPGSDFERDFADGAAAFLVCEEGARVIIEDSCAVADEILDVWRTDEDQFVRSWEERFNLDEGYLRVMPQAVAALMERGNLSAEDFSRAAFYGPNPKRHKDMAKRLGFKPEQVQPPVISDAGAASSLIMLAASLEQAKPGDRLLLASYGNGADAFSLKVVDGVRVSPALSDYVNSKKLLKDYKSYLHWRGVMPLVTGRRRPPTPSPSASCIWRERDQNIRLRGVRCRSCGMVQYPPLEVCYHCHTRAQFDSYRLSDRKASLATFTVDYANPTPDPPLVLAVLDFEGGGRMWAYMTDKEAGQISIGMPLEMTFRRLHTVDGIHNYYWKSMPVRF